MPYWMRRLQRKYLTIGVILAVVIVAYSVNQSGWLDFRLAPHATISGIAYAIDGDTIRLDGRTKIRLSGVAAPETYERGGPEATSFMKMLVNGRNVDCDLDGTRTYDRLVGICYLDGSDIGEAVIAAGLARDCPRYSHGRYRSVEQPSAASLTFPRYCSRW